MQVYGVSVCVHVTLGVKYSMYSDSDCGVECWGQTVFVCSTEPRELCVPDIELTAGTV